MEEKHWSAPRYKGQHPSHRRIENLLSEHTGTDVLTISSHVYVEVYDQVQRYGGPEEGGWYGHLLFPQGSCVPVVSAVIAQGGPDVTPPEHLDNSPVGVEYFLVRAADLVDDSNDDDGHWWLHAALTEDLERTTRMLAELGFDGELSRYGDGKRILTSGHPGQHAVHSLPRYQ